MSPVLKRLLLLLMFLLLFLPMLYLLLLRFALTLCRDGTADPDGLSYPFLRHLHPAGMEFLLSFFNWLYTSELLSNLWRQSIIILIPKPGKDHSLPGTFHPISLTSYLFKLLE